MRGRREPEHGKWPWPATGAAVGVMIAVGWWASTFGDRPVGITFAANTGHLLTYPMVGYPNRVTWSMLMALGVPLGAFVAAWTTAQFNWKFPAASSLLKIFLGGLLMGAAALVAEGCNINQGLTNSATLALGSLLTFASMCGGACLDALVPVRPQSLRARARESGGQRRGGRGWGSDHDRLTRYPVRGVPNPGGRGSELPLAGNGSPAPPPPPAPLPARSCACLFPLAVSFCAGSACWFSETGAQDDHLYFFARLDRGFAGDDGEAVGGDH